MYTLFKKSFAEDSDFWKQLAYEELSHAALLKNAISNTEMSKQIVNDVPNDLLQEIVQAKEGVTSLLIKFLKLSLID